MSVVDTFVTMALLKHVEGPENNWENKFEFLPTNFEKVRFELINWTAILSQLHYRIICALKKSLVQSMDFQTLH